MIKPHYLFERLYELKRIELRMNEQQKYDVIKSLVDHNGNKKAAALKLGCTIRTINRLISKYKKQGKSAFIHGNRGRKPAHAISDALIDDIITLYNHKYYDATFSHACELLAENDDIFISPSALTNIMYKNLLSLLVLQEPFVRDLKHSYMSFMQKVPQNENKMPYKLPLWTSLILTPGVPDLRILAK